MEVSLMMCDSYQMVSIMISPAPHTFSPHLPMLIHSSKSRAARMAAAPAHSVLALIKAGRPLFKSPADKVVYAAHSVVAINGLKLLAVGERACTDPLPDASAPEVPVDGWNDGVEEYSFLYGLDPDAAAPASGARTLLLKCLPMDGTLLVTILASSPVASGSQAPETVELDITRHAVPEAAAAGDGAASLSPSQYGQLQELVNKVQAALDAQGQNCNPAASAPHQLEAGRRSAKKPTAAAVPAKAAQGSQAGEAGRNPYPEEKAAWRGPARSPLMVGDEDFRPGGFADPLMLPGPLGRRPEGMPLGPHGGGMHVGPDHPFFADRMRNPSLIAPGRGGGRGPPGARWDPIAPEGLQGWNPDDFQRGEGGLGGGGLRGPPVHPDIMQPGPGRGTDWDEMFG